MSVDPSQMQPGVSGPQGLTNTSVGMPPNAQPAPPPGAPMDPSQMPPGGPPMGPPPVHEKPASVLPATIGRALAEQLNKAKLQAAQQLGNYMGDPRGTVNASKADLLRVWRKRNPTIDPLYEKIVNGKSDDEIMYDMYPLRRALIRFGRRTYTEQVKFAEEMAKIDKDPKYKHLDDLDEEDDYLPPQPRWPAKGDKPLDETDKAGYEQPEEQT